MNRSIWFSCLLFCTGLSQVVNAASTTFTDGDFSGWEDIVLITDDEDFSGPGPGTSSGSIDLLSDGFGGNPGLQRRHIHEVDSGDRVWTIGINRNVSYDPTVSGAIESLDFSIDLLEDPGIGGSSGVGLIIEQGGILFIGGGGAFSASSFSVFAVSGLMEHDFDSRDLNTSVPGGIQPDFVSGAPIFFGYTLANTVEGSGSLVLSHRADNWSVTVNPIPVPAAVWLFGSALLLLGWVKS